MVVAPDEYADIARKLVHIISSKDDFSSAFWTIKKYKDNEQTIRGSQYVIFLGNEDQNELTKDHLQVIKLEHDKGGVCYGYDGTKAVMFGTGKKLGFLEFLYSEIIMTNIISFVAPSPGSMVLRYLKQKKDMEQLSKNQTELAVDLFMNRRFEEWVSPKNSDKLQ